MLSELSRCRCRGVDPDLDTGGSAAYRRRNAAMISIDRWIFQSLNDGLGS
jgi:hypothetical protein